jgi:hypothetical protein
MQTLQEQDQDLSNPHPLCRKATFPRVSIDEYRIKNVYQEVWNYSTLMRKDGGCKIGRNDIGEGNMERYYTVFA